MLSPQKETAPSGEKFRDRFTGKEDQDPDFGTAYTDFGARQYSPALRRWLVPDPLSEKYYGISPYAYCAGDPVNLVDPDGKRHRLKRHSNRITVIASYYTTDVKSYESALQGVSFWNERKADFYIDKETGNKYEIRYKLSVRLKKEILEKDFNGKEPVNYLSFASDLGRQL